MSIFSFRHRLAIEGIMPERALLRLQRAQIPLYGVKKTQKNQILLSVNEKDVEKVFAIYPKVCYNRRVHSTYVVRDLGERGLARAGGFLKARAGFVLGALAFCAITLFADTLVLGVEVRGTPAYTREVRQTLSDYGVSPFSRYGEKNVDLICAKLLSLDGVEYCSVKKSGLRVVVELRTSPFPTVTAPKGDLLSAHSGTLLSITVLKGTPLKKAGDRVQAGEKLAGGYFLTQGGEYKSVRPVARASVACTYETEIGFSQAEDEKQAFAIAYLSLGLRSRDELKSVTAEKTETGYRVKLEYVAIEVVNM